MKKSFTVGFHSSPTEIKCSRCKAVIDKEDKTTYKHNKEVVCKICFDKRGAE